MKQKYIAFFLVFSMSSLAGVAYSRSTFNGFYVGGAAGGSFTTAEQTTSSSIIIDFPNASGSHVFTNVPSNSSTDMKKNSGIGSLFVGYGYVWQSLYLGGELFVNGSNYNAENSQVISTTQFFSNSNQSYNAISNGNVQTKLSPVQYGVDFRPGILLNSSTLLYGRVGLAVADVTLDSNTTGGITYSFDNITDNFSFTLPTSVTDSKIAWRVGSGLEYHLNSCWALRADYAYTYYGNINVGDGQNKNVTAINPSFGSGTLSVANNTKVKSLANNAITLGLSYYFL